MTQAVGRVTVLAVRSACRVTPPWCTISPTIPVTTAVRRLSPGTAVPAPPTQVWHTARKHWERTIYFRHLCFFKPFVLIEKEM